VSNLQVKNLEPEVHEQLRQRVADEGVTISEYVLELIRRDLRRPSRRQWLDTVTHLPRHDFSRDEVSGALEANRERR
jgi:post-segregation antitoxin (ccd killing protein)